MNRGDNLADEHHVLRYVKPSHVDRHSKAVQITGSAFLCRPDEDTCSVNWMECFDPPIDNQCACIRAEKRITYKASAKLARLNVGKTRKSVLEEAQVILAFVYDPEEPASPRLPKSQLSHSIIAGMPKLDTIEGELVGALLRDCIPDADVLPVEGG